MAFEAHKTSIALVVNLPLSNFLTLPVSQFELTVVGVFLVEVIFAALVTAVMEVAFPVAFPILAADISAIFEFDPVFRMTDLFPFPAKVFGNFRPRGVG